MTQHDELLHELHHTVQPACLRQHIGMPNVKQKVKCSVMCRSWPMLLNVLQRMQKNYHAWAHRQAIVRRFGLWQQELDAVDELLHEDIRNNSAWNQRFFIISESLNG